MNFNSRDMRRLLDPLHEFLRSEAAGGVVLAVAAVVALVWANSPAADSYNALWEHKLTIGPGGAAVTEDLRHWVNDGLMTIFFFVIGVEIKRQWSPESCAILVPRCHQCWLLWGRYPARGDLSGAERRRFSSSRVGGFRSPPTSLSRSGS